MRFVQYGDQVIPVFTVEEAKNRLPLLKPRLKKLRGLWKVLQVEQERLNSFAGELEKSSSHELLETVERLRNELVEKGQEAQEEIQEIYKLGALVKDPATGLIDFYSQQEDSLVFLCWKLDEPDLAWWHDLESGIVGRQPL